MGSEIPNSQFFRFGIGSKFCNLIILPSEVDAELPLALRKINFKRVLPRCSRRDMRRGLARDQLTAKKTMAKFGILEPCPKNYEPYSENFEPYSKISNLVVFLCARRELR